MKLHLSLPSSKKQNPDSHDFSEDGSREVSFEDFLYEAGEKLVLLGIL